MGGTHTAAQLLSSRCELHPLVESARRIPSGGRSNRQSAAVLWYAAAEGQGKARKLSITLIKQPAAAGQQRYVWDSLLLSTEDAPKFPVKRDQAAKSG